MGLIKSLLGKNAPINEIIGLLASFGEKELSVIKNQYPEYENILKLGIPLGEKEIEEEQEVKELKVRSEVCKIGLELILKKSEELVPRLKSKLKLLNSVQFISQIIVTISGASILIFLQDKHGDPLKLVIGGLTLLSGLLSLFVQHKSGTIALGENSLTKIFNDLTDYKLKAEHFLEELIIIEKLNFSSSTLEVTKIVSDSNEISLQMKKIIEKF